MPQLLPLKCFFSQSHHVWRHCEKGGDSPAVTHSSRGDVVGAGCPGPHIPRPCRGLSSCPCCPWVASERKMDFGSPNQNSRSGLERQIRPFESQEEKEPIAKPLESKLWGMGRPCTGNTRGRFLRGVRQNRVPQEQASWTALHRSKCPLSSDWWLLVYLAGAIFHLVCTSHLAFTLGKLGAHPWNSPASGMCDGLTALVLLLMLCQKAGAYVCFKYMSYSP